MNNIQRLFSNTSLAFLSSILSKASNSLLFIFIGRMLGPGDAGTFNLGITYFSIVFGLSALGLHEIFVREVAGNLRKSQSYFYNYLLLRLVFSTIFYLLLIVSLWAFLPYSEFTRNVILILTLTVFPEGVFSIFESLFVSHKNFWPPAKAAFISSGIKLIVGGWLLFQGGNALTIAWVLPVGSFIALLFIIPDLSRVWESQMRPALGNFSWTLLIETLKTTPDFMVIHIFSLLDYQTDAFLISIFLTETHVAWYGSAQTTLLAFWSLPIAIRHAIYPLMVQYFQDNRAVLAEFYEEVIRLLLVAILPIAAGVYLLSEPIILLIFREPFAPSIPALQIMIWTVVFVIINVPSARLLLIDNRQREAAIITGFSMALNIVLNIVLIPRMEIIGAAYARLIATILFSGMIYFAAQRYVLRQPIFHLFHRPLLATGMMAAGVWLAEPLGVFLQVVVGLLLYLLFIVLLKGITRKDYYYVAQLTKFN